MIQELGLTRNAGIYEDILRWGQRMANTTITSEQVVFLASKKVFSNDTLHVFEKFRRYGTSDLDDGNKQLGFEVVLADWFLENLNHRFVVPQDFSAYKKLGRPISKGIFGYLHLAFFASGGRPVEKNYADLCSELGIATYTAISKIRSTLEASLDELVNIQYLSKWAIDPLIGKRGYKIVFRRRRGAHNLAPTWRFRYGRGQSTPRSWRNARQSSLPGPDLWFPESV
jgi:hypothetical protein